MWTQLKQSASSIDRRQAAYTLIILAAVIGFAGSNVFFSASNVESKYKYQFMTDSSASCYYSSISNGLTVDGQRIYLENLEAATTSEGGTNLVNPDQPIAVLHYGSDSKKIYKGMGSVRFKDIVFEVEQLEARYVTSGLYCGQYTYGRDYINNILWGFEFDIPKDRITATVSNVTVETTSPGAKKVAATVEVENNWRAFNVDRLSAEVFDKRVDLATGTIPEGTSTYQVVTSKSFYDSSKFLVNKEVNSSITVFFENPRIPDGSVNGQPNIDGDWGRYEGFADGGSQPSIQDLREGDDRYSAVDSPCDIQFLRSHGFSQRDCHGYSGGSSTPMDTQNWLLTLQDFQSEPAGFSTKVQYCGERASFENGQCVIDEELHVRGDVCPLLSNHQVVTETFLEGQHSLSEVQPEPAFFCTKHPVLVTNAEGQQTEFTTKPYNELVGSGGFTVPEGQTYTLYWTVDTREVEVQTVCEEGSLNKTTGRCEVTPGVIHKCTEGVWDSSTGSCVVHPEVKNVCEEGRFNSELGVCVFNPEVVNQCPAGSALGADGMCYSQASVKRVCPDGVEGTVRGGVCVTEDVQLIKRSPVSSFYVFLFDVGNWVDEQVDAFSESVASIPVLG